jgi:mRNA-degrading endonuclease RelE of RelBE toxin-antitoxin system
MIYKIVPTHTFGRELKRLTKKHRSIKNDVELLGEQLEENPIMGMK